MKLINWLLENDYDNESFKKVIEKFARHSLGMVEFKLDIATVSRLKNMKREPTSHQAFVIEEFTFKEVSLKDMLYTLTKE